MRAIALIKNLFVAFIVFSMVSSCQVDQGERLATLNNEATSLAIESRSDRKSLLERKLNQSFKEDFITSPRDTANSTVLDAEDITFMKPATSRDLVALADAYEMLKPGLEQRYNKPEEERKETVIETVALRFLRNFLLIEQSEHNRAEALWLLEILVDLKSVDIDVLVDAYIYTKALMPEEKQLIILNYMVDLHDRQIDYIKSNYPDYQLDFESASSNVEKKQALHHSRSLERKSKACHYARETVPELAALATY